MSPTYRKRRRQRLLQRSRKGVVARERKRMAEAETDPQWRRVWTGIVTVDAAPDGRHVALRAHGHREWFRCGSERAVRGALARLLWGLK
jgi:hypothetical protein